MKFTALFIITLCVVFGIKHSTALQTLGDQSEEPDFQYPHNIYSERGLVKCKQYSACNILHRRLWFKLRVERLCRCPDFTECPTDWQNHSDNYSLVLNNRSQMKFCSILNNLTICTPGKTALSLTINSSSISDIYNKNHTIPIIYKHAEVSCQCQYPSYWMLQNSSSVDNITINEYSCEQLQKCSTGEFCGNIRADYFSAYYQCSCPTGHYCLIGNNQKDRKLHSVTELLFEGPAYKAKCTPFP